MASLKQLRNRVKSIKSTQKITKAMQLVAAAKLKKVKEQAEQLNLYSDILAQIMNNIATSDHLLNLSHEDSKFFSKELEELPYLFIVMTSERGLCGSFNSSIIKAVKADINKLWQQNKQVKLLIIGKKGKEALKNLYSDQIIGTYQVVSGNYESIAREVKTRIIELIETRQTGSCYMYYNSFKNAMTQIMTVEKILPAKSPSNKTDYQVSEYEYEGQSLVRDIINLYIHGEIGYGLLQSQASEEGARMTAMENATKNANELIDGLTLQLNRSRQAIITTELTEIISGAESL